MKKTLIKIFGVLFSLCVASTLQQKETQGKCFFFFFWICKALFSVEASFHGNREARRDEPYI